MHRRTFPVSRDGRSAILLVAALLAACGSAPAKSGSSSSTASDSRCPSSITGSQVVGGALPSGGITESAARAIAAHEAASISAIPVTYLYVCVGRLREVDPRAGPGQGEPPDPLVWQFFFGGRFLPPSCGPAPHPGESPHACPSPQAKAHVVLDYQSGKPVELGTPPS